MAGVKLKGEAIFGDRRKGQGRSEFWAAFNRDQRMDQMRATVTIVMVIAAMMSRIQSVF